MNRKALIITLICSLVVNIVGVIFFVRYLGALGTLRNASFETTQLANSLTFAQTANIVTSLAAPDNVDRHAFISHFDGEEDVFATCPIALPTRTKEVTLFVFLHGMGHNCMEPFIMPQGSPLSERIITKDHSYLMLAPNYRQPAGWVSDAALSDITQTIHIVCQQYPVKHIVLIGSSMGGCVALSYSFLAPQDIKAKLQGVVSIEGSGDFAGLYSKTNMSSVRATLEQCFGGNPSQVSVAYAAKSLMPNMAGVPGQTRLAIVSARQDKTVPPEFQDEVYKAWSGQGRPGVLIPVEMDHGWPPLEIVLKAIDFVLESTPQADGQKKHR